ncbi:TIGR03118 family protein [Actinomadura gamaensis]|uniref:TIGR03118 family protein n=1 Tax=Actinomadura gamaensis TaxID=1763541 RepID=A0ABV9U5T7_9ACTN
MSGNAKRLGIALAGIGTAALVAVAGLPAQAEQGQAGAHQGRAPAPTRFVERDLVADQPGRAKLTDPTLVNPWGVALGPDTPVWVGDNGADAATRYRDGAVKVPPNIAVEGGAPTGEVYNDTGSFTVHGAPARFILASEAGLITAWNPATGTRAVKVASGADAVYKGLALVHASDGPRLLAADFHNHRVDIFTGTFQRVSIPGAFTDPTLPPSYSPFDVATIGGLVYVAYAQKQANGDDEVDGPGLGFVDVYTPLGQKVRRLVSQGALNAPWAMVRAPQSFGTYAGDILIGNFGDGRINAYTPSGVPKGPLTTASGQPLTIGGLWGLARGNAVAGGPGNLWFAAGTDDEAHGTLGLITPAP